MSNSCAASYVPIGLRRTLCRPDLADSGAQLSSGEARSNARFCVMVAEGLRLDHPTSRLWSLGGIERGPLQAGGSHHRRFRSRCVRCAACICLGPGSLPQGAGFLLLPAQLLVVLSPLHHGTAELSPLHALFPLSRARRHSARQPRPRSQIQIDSDRPLLSPSAFRFEARPMQRDRDGV